MKRVLELKKELIILLVAAVSISAFAETNASLETSVSVAADKNWTLTPSITLESLATPKDDASASADFSFDVEGTYRIAENYTSILDLSASQNLIGEKIFKPEDGSLIVSRKPTELGRAFKLGFSAQALLPFFRRNSS